MPFARAVARSPSPSIRRSVMKCIRRGCPASAAISLRFASGPTCFPSGFSNDPSGVKQATHASGSRSSTAKFKRFKRSAISSWSLGVNGTRFVLSVVLIGLKSSRHHQPRPFPRSFPPLVTLAWRRYAVSCYPFGCRLSYTGTFEAPAIGVQPAIRGPAAYGVFFSAIGMVQYSS